MPIVQADKPEAVMFVKDYLENLRPEAFEICFNERNAYVEEVLDMVKASGSKIWINTLWPSLCAGLNDDRAVEQHEADASWGEVLKMNASFIQTDRPRELIDYLRKKNRFVNSAAFVRTNLLSRNQGYVHVVAHRGDWKRYPENSLDAIESVISMGGDIVEIDVQRTKDGVLILMHDETVDRTTNGHGRVSEMTFNDIRKLKLKDYKGNVTEYKVPTLKEALVLARGRIMLNLDKVDRFFEQVIGLLQETGTMDLAIMKSTCLYEEAKKNFGAYFDDVIYMPMIRMEQPVAEKNMVDFMNSLSPVAFEVGFESNSNPLPKKAIRIVGGKSLLWYNSLKGRNGGHDDIISLDDPDKGYGYLIDELGARMIQTDEPQRLLDYLHKRGLR